VGDRLVIEKQTKEVKLKDSPALVEYNVQCGKNTVPGDISLIAHIDGYSSDIEMNLPQPPEAAGLKIHVN
jgi:hypothetical protein